MTSETVPTTPNQPGHSYATRIRHPISNKASVRLRLEPDVLRALRPAPEQETIPTSELAPFPSPNVVLHPDDANSKVFHAIARSLLSVDNRAMTVKDLAEMCIAHGLQCQNLNAASQAITTYTRDHLKRCEQEQDQPLLLRHILSGTSSDDLLSPALHSTSGGGCQRDPLAEASHGRTTNFRKGTVIWYLSRVTGAQCPFARAGIRLCDHVDPSLALPKPSTKRSKETRADQCGDKRKRRSTRECVVRATRHSGSRSPGPSDDERSDAEQPPTKVKLIVRLKPLAKCFAAPTPEPPTPTEIIDLSLDADDESDAMSVDDGSVSGRDSPAGGDLCTQVYLRSMSIPPYSSSSEFSAYGSHRASESFTRYRRSTSVPYSTASPPPDSDDEDEDDSAFGSPTASTSYANSPFDNDGYASSDFSSDFGDNDADTSFESPGPRSPFSAPPISLPSIKQEPRDVQGILDAWDDMEGSSVFAVSAPSTEEEAKVVEVIGKAATCLLESGHMKEESDVGDWDTMRYRLSSSPLDVKQEDDSPDMTLDLRSPSFTSWRASDLPVSPLSASTPGFDFDDFHPFDSYSSPHPRRGSETLWNREEPHEYTTLRPRANTVASLGGMFSTEEYGLDRTNTLTRSLTSLIESLSVTTSLPSTFVQDEDRHKGSVPPPVCVSPNDIRRSFASSEVTIVSTCQPANPPIFATQIENVLVYQTSLGEHVVLRRVEDNLVNLTPVLAYSRTPPPVLSTISSVQVVTEGPALLRGTWVPLEAAQAYVNDHPVSTSSCNTGALDVFLSSRLSDKFPFEWRSLVQTSLRHTNVRQLGKSFNGLQVRELADLASTSLSPLQEEVPNVSSEPVRHDEPLTAKEQEIFRSICVNLEWEHDEPSQSSLATPHAAVEHTAPLPDDSDSRPLRRSKRVADLAAKTRPRR